MKKSITIFSFIIMICACVFGASFSVSAQSDTDDGDKLFMPTSYEQYLELTDPSDFVISDKYIAIADKKTSEKTVLYLFNRAENKYKSYDVITTNTVSSLNFYSTDDNDYLFFLETGNLVNYISCKTFSQHEKVDNFSASAMYINGNEIYYAIQTSASSNVHFTTITNLSIDTESAKKINSNPIETSNYPTFSEYNQNVYFSANNHVYLCLQESMSEKYNTINAINHFIIFGESSNCLIYTTNIVGNILIGANNTTPLQNKSATVVKYYNGHAYFLTSNGILKYDIENEKFTDYEINKYSASLNRLNAPSDISMYGDKTVIADKGNERVIIYDGENYVAVTTDKVIPSKVCAGANNFIVANGAAIYVYDYSGKLLNETASININSDVSSATFSIDTYYIISSNGSTYSLDDKTLTISDAHSPQIENALSITADLYGNVYVLNSTGQITSYPVSSFFSNETAIGTSVARFNSDCKKILVDFNGNIYGLSDSTISIYKNGTVSSQNISFENFVYDGENKTARSFAFSLTDGSVYILSDGFIITKEIGVSTFKNISADELYNSVYQSAPSSNALIVNIPKGSIAVNLNATALNADSSVLPYLSYERLANDESGIVLGVIDAGYVVAIYKYTDSSSSATLPSREYKICLISANNAASPTPNTSYFTEEEKTGYLSSNVNLYRRPLMQDFSKIKILERNTAVSVLGKVSLSKNIIDSDYYFVKLADGNFGFIPSSFITESVSINLENETFSYQTLKKGKTATLTAATGESITLNNKEELRVYNLSASNEGYKVVSYEKDGVTYYGEVSKKSLNSASPLVIITLVIVMLVTASVLLSSCYLLLRKKPSLD